MRALHFAVVGFSLGLLAGAGPASAYCNGSGMETGTGFDCEDGSVGVFAGSGAGRSYLTDDGDLGFIVGSGSSRSYDDLGGYGGTILGGNSILGGGSTGLIITDDGRWGTVTRHGNTNFIDLDPAFEADMGNPWPMGSISQWQGSGRRKLTAIVVYP